MDRSTRAIDAVVACTRTLAEGRDVGALFADVTGTSLGALRAHADRVALRRKYHDGVVDAHRPEAGVAAQLFDALALARVDALGAGWLRGVAENLLSHPAEITNGLRWLAFEAFAGRGAPAATSAARHDAAARVSAQLVSELSSLAAHCGDPDTFGRAAREWALVACRTQPAERDGDRPLGVSIVPPPPGRDDVRRGRYALPGARRLAPSPIQGTTNPHSAPAAADDPVAALIGYRAYTRAFDRVISAATLATRDEMMRLRRELDAEFSGVRPVVARVAKRLLRVLMARQAREWRFDLDDGVLDASRLSALVASRGKTRPFKRELESPFPSTVVSLLLDHSGSMRGRPMRIAALTVEIVARVLERCGVRCEVLGFTTRDWDGGQPAIEWAAAGYPESPGRLNALEHIVIKAADVPWRRARQALGLLLHEEMLKENIDGEGLVWAHGRLRARPERRRILIVISDGTPMDEATCAANGFDYLDGHLAAVVQDLERRSDVRLAAIGIGHDVSRFYRNATRIRRVDDLGAALASKLITLLDT